MILFYFQTFGKGWRLLNVWSEVRGLTCDFLFLVGELLTSLCSPEEITREGNYHDRFKRRVFYTLCLTLTLTEKGGAKLWFKHAGGKALQWYYDYTLLFQTVTWWYCLINWLFDFGFNVFEHVPGWSLPLFFFFFARRCKSDSSTDELLSFYKAETLSLISSLIMNVKGYAPQQEDIYLNCLRQIFL